MYACFIAVCSSPGIYILCRFKKGKLFYKTRKELWVEVIMDKSQQVQIIKACHSDPAAGHLGRTRTFYKASERYYWPGIYNQVSQFVSVAYLLLC